MLTEVLIFAGAVFAFGFSSIIGGGASVVLIPILGFVLPISEVPGALVIGTFTNSLGRSIALSRKIRWNLVILFVPAALPSVALGAWLLRFVDPLIITWICALFLISNIPFLFRRDHEQNANQESYKSYKVVGIGFLAGLLSGITGAIGLVFNGFYLKLGLSKEEIVATRAANEILLHLVKLILYVGLGLFSIHSICIGTVIALAAVLSSVMVQIVLPYLNESMFRRLGYAAMCCSGFFLLGQTSCTILKEKTPTLRLISIEDGFETKVKWEKRTTVFEIEYDGNVSFERVVLIQMLPTSIASQVQKLSNNSDQFVVEEVYGWKKHYYEVYLTKKGKVFKYEIDPLPFNQSKKLDSIRAV
jgi:uncharacterized membrane protein YfcA